jgi:hypothetical protein
LLRWPETRLFILADRLPLMAGGPVTYGPFAGPGAQFS